MIRSHYPDLAGSEGSELAARTFELSQFLVDIVGVGSLGNGLAGRRVAYHHGCHALRELRVEQEPLTLLRGAGAEVVSWETDRECCGFGGLFSTKMPEVSAAMADGKLDTLPEVDVVTSADGGCLMQLGGRSTRRGSGPPFVHLASLLWQGVAG
jgi:L-lactate dehydrogenase complex protein LldE